MEMASAQADGELSQTEAERFNAHASACTTCSDALGSYEDVRRRCLINPTVDLSDLRHQVIDALDVPTARGSAWPRLAAAAAVAACLCVLAGVVANWTGSPTAPDRSITRVIQAHGRTFDLTDLEVPLGSTVEWHNVGNDDHLLEATVGGATVRSALGPGDDQSVTFTEPGEYRFGCGIHASMSGTVTVDT